MPVPTMPRLVTDRLVLRPFRPADASVVNRLVGEREVADTTLVVPHPYEESMAVEWIADQGPAWAERRMLTLAITRRDTAGLIGCISLVLNTAHSRAELGYWIGREFWGRGYATESAAALIAHGFRELDLLRIHAGHFARNPASGRVLEKVGMRREGVLRRHVLRWGRREDEVMWGLLREEWAARAGGAASVPGPDAEPSEA